MKKLFILFVLVIALMISCNSAPKFSDVTGKEWKLIEVYADGKDILFDRETLSNEDAGDIFTLNIDAGNISGTGAPNRYTAPYTLGKNQAISITIVNATLMAAIRQPEKLKEQEFFVFMQNIYEWGFANEKLELHTKTENGAEVKLVFSL